MGKWRKFLYGFLLVNGFWLLFSWWMDRTILPSPLAVYANLLHLFTRQQMFRHIGHSLWRIFASLGISTLLGLFLGLLMAQSRFWNKLIDPFIYFTYPIPKISLLPAVMLLFGMGDGSKIIMIVLIVSFQIIINVRDSIRNIPKESYHILLCLGAGKWRLFWEVTLPAALSSVLSSIRVALGTTMSILFFTENYGTRFGMGFFIMDSWMRINYVQMYGGIVVLSAVGFLMFTGLDLLEERFLKWRD